MLNIVVYAKTNNETRITENCISYHKAKWATVRDFKKMYKSQKPEIVGLEGADFAENAMCVKMACDFLDHK